MQSSKSKPEVSIIVCHHLGDFIYKFVESVKASTFTDYEIIVITSDEKLATNGIKGCVTFHSTAMPAEKRNIGSRLAKGKYLAFFDDDVEVTQDCLYFLRQAFDKYKKIGMVYGKLYNMEHRNRFDEAGGFITSTGFIWSRAGQNEIDRGQYDEPELIFSGKSASCMIRRDVFEKIGGFDDDFEILGEESDLSWRVWLSGFHVLWEPNSVAYHAFNTKFKPAEKFYTSKRVQYNGCRNYITMLVKNLEWRNLWKMLIIQYLVWTYAAIAMIITGKANQGLNILKGLGYTLRKASYILEKRKKIQERRVVSDKDIWPNIFRRTPAGYYRQRFIRYLKIGLHG